MLNQQSIVVYSNQLITILTWYLAIEYEFPYQQDAAVNSKHLTNKAY